MNTTTAGRVASRRSNYDSVRDALAPSPSHADRSSDALRRVTSRLCLAAQARAVAPRRRALLAAASCLAVGAKRTMARARFSTGRGPSRPVTLTAYRRGTDADCDFRACVQPCSDRVRGQRSGRHRSLPGVRLTPSILKRMRYTCTPRLVTGRRCMTQGPLAVAMVGVLAFAGCGGDEQATEQRIQRERAEAAVIAKQEERIKLLEREARKKEARGSPATVTQAPPPERPAAAPPATSTDNTPRSDDWPGGPGYTTILASVPSEAEARRIQTQASERGLDAGVLFSSNYRSLRSGYWVVFSGTSSRKKDADQRSARAKSLGYPEAYPRFVSG